MRVSRIFSARIMIEMETPLKTGTGESGLLSAALVFSDCNGLPMIPGTSLTGILRHSYEVETIFKSGTTNFAINEIFGSQNDSNSSDRVGSRIIVSDGHIIGLDGLAVEGLNNYDTDDPYYSRFNNLPSRHHCKINSKGTSDTLGHGKFEEQVVYKGTRFIFEIILKGTTQDSLFWEDLLARISHPVFRIGGGTRNGFGEVSVVDVARRDYNLNKKDDLEAYLNRSSSLRKQPDSINKQNDEKIEIKLESLWEKIEIDLEPKDFWLFGAGNGDEEADIVSLKESVVTWKNGLPRFSDIDNHVNLVIPATSFKGALAHRTAFHYNLMKGTFADDKDLEANDFCQHTDQNNEAVKNIFGFISDKKGNDNENQGQIGRIVFSDCYLPLNNQSVVLNHVKLDRFTQGAFKGALFNEKVENKTDPFKLIIYINNNIPDKYRKAFDNALNDLKTGFLPLGGGTMRGNGVFLEKTR